MRNEENSVRAEGGGATHVTNPHAWDERIRHGKESPLAVYDDMRARCPIDHSKHFHWSLFKHQDILAVINDHENFSSNVSAHVSVPNGMDPPEHTAYRAIIERHFSPQVLANFEPKCHRLAVDLVTHLMGIEDLAQPINVDVIQALAQPFALQVQCAFLGWPEALQAPLAEWMTKNQQASLAQDKTRTTAVAEEFSAFIHSLLEERRAAGVTAEHDIITELLHTTVAGRPLQEDEIVSVLRNWTAGEVGTIAAAVGILIHFLAEQQALQTTLREQPEKLPEAIDEILRIHGPLLTNRRITRCPVKLAEQAFEAGERLTLFWISANRDPDVFPQPDEFRWGRDHSKNLTYGAGIHVCPGASLARMELRLIMTALLTHTKQFSLTPKQQLVYAMYPASGFKQLYVSVR